MKQFMQTVSALYSFLGYNVLRGSIEAVKFLWANICREQPALIKTVSFLQDRLTAIELMNDSQNIYSDEFLYYWGLICVGGASPLIVKNLDTAIFCFDKIREAVPKAEARLAYIDLLLHAGAHKSDENARKLDILREWAGRGDLFSMVALSKITYEHFLRERQEEDSPTEHSLSDVSIRAARLLELPCQIGHPEAINFYNAMRAAIGTEVALGRKIDASCFNTDVLYDF